MASAVFRTKLRRLLTYKGMQPSKNGAIWCEKYSPGPFGSCATAVREEEEEEEDEDETWEKSRALSTCRPPSLKSKVSYMLCSVPDSSWEVSFAVSAPIQEYSATFRLYYSIQPTTDILTAICTQVSVILT